MVATTIKHYEVDIFGLMCVINKTMKYFKRNNKCCYVDWIALNLGMKKSELTRILIDNPHLFILTVGKKSGKLMIKDVTAYPFAMYTTYYINDVELTPVCYLNSTNEIVYEEKICNKRYFKAEKVGAFFALITNCLKGEKDEFERNCEKQ